MYGESREREEFPAGNNHPAQQHQHHINGGNNTMASTTALGLEALHSLCREVYPEQTNPLTVTAVVKYWYVFREREREDDDASFVYLYICLFFSLLRLLCARGCVFRSDVPCKMDGIFR